MILVFDTETSGKADFRAPFTAPHQPHLVQLGAQLLDNDYQVRGEINLIIQPAGWFIPKEASDIHGITNEIALDYGVDLGLALQIFSSFALRAKVYVAHNLDFDSLIMATAFYRTDGDGAWHTDDAVKFCTMQAMTDVCKLPGNYGDWKWPKLQEAYRHCFGEEFKGAHDAMADVRACARVYRWLMERVKPAPVEVGGAA